MRQLLFLITICIVALTQSSVSVAAEIRIFVETEGINILPKVIPIKPTEQVQDKMEKGTLVIHLDFSKSEIRKPILIQFASELPTDYKFKDLELDTPFYAKNETIHVPLAPTKVQGTAPEVRKHYGTNVTNNITDDILPIFYQNVRASALARIRRLNENWSRVSIRDVQSVFVYLLTVRELNHRTFIVSPDDISKTLSWMKSVIEHKPKIVERAVKTVHAQQAIEQVENSEGQRFGRLWKAINNMESCETKYPFLLEYKKTLFAIPYKDRLRRINKVTGVYKGNVLSGLAQCLSANIRCRTNTVLEPSNQIKDLLVELRNELLSTGKGTPLGDEIISAIESLRGLNGDINEGNPMVCDM